MAIGPVGAKLRFAAIVVRNLRSIVGLGRECWIFFVSPGRRGGLGLYSRSRRHFRSAFLRRPRQPSLRAH